jgi:hypothetical protein
MVMTDVGQDYSSLKQETDQFIDNTHRMLSINHAQQRDIESLQNWLEGNVCLSEEESAYLTHGRDLVSLAPVEDSATLQFETWVESGFIQLWRKFSTVNYHGT